MWLSRGSVVIVCLLVCVAPRSPAADAIDAYAAAVQAEPGIVAHWRMQGDLHDSKGRLNGKAHGAIAYVDGVAGGKAISLDGGGYVTFGDAPALDLDATTVELLFKINAEITAPYNPCIIAKRRSSPETRFSIHVMRDLKSLALWNGQTVALTTPPDGPLQVGRWYHLAVTHQPRQTRVYLDGVPCAWSAGEGLFTTTAKGLPLQVGASAPDGAEQFNGALDEVAIYNVALTAEAIAAHVDALGWAEKRAGLALKRKQQEEEEKRAAEERRRMNQERIAERLADPALTAAGDTRVYEGEHLTAISLPVGGIGAGQIQFNGNAEPCAWQIFNNHTMARVPHSFLAVRAEAQGATPVVRAVQTSAVGPFQAMERLRFRGEYPFGWYDFVDAELPVRVALEVFNPLVPLNAKDSAIPCAILNLTAENPSDKPAAVTFLASQQNAVGYAGAVEIDGHTCEHYGNNANRITRANGCTLLHMTKADPDAGDMALAVFTGDAHATASWDGLDVLCDELIAKGAVGGPETAGPSPSHQTLDGALSVAFTLGPREKRTVTFVLAWHFPNTVHGQPKTGWEHEGNMYANWWKNAADVVQYVRRRIEDLTRLTRLYHDTFYASNLPRWLLDRITSQVAILRSPTVFWAKDGYIGGWEGCNPGGGCCYGNCAHVWHYAQAHARLFPAIGRQMREQILTALKPDGAAPFRQPKEGIACDAQCGEVLEAYREHLTSTDQVWLDAHWPAIRKALEYAINTWDADEDGALSGSQHNTLDCFLGGSTSWLGSMYLAALEAASKMAVIERDADAAARFRRIHDAGAVKQNGTLFNGEYYIQIPDPQPLSDYGNGCHIDQVLGQWWAHQVDLGWQYPPDRVRSALAALLQHNFRDNFHGIVQVPRKFVDDNDAGMQMIQWPNGDRPQPHTLYADEVMSGFEYSAAAAMVQAGMLKEGLMVAKAVADRYDGRIRTGLTGNDCTSWGYSGNPFGDDECGKFYARAMSVWSMLLACQGFIYDGPAGRIGFTPVWQPEDHASFFTAAEGWGLFTQKRDGTKQQDTIALCEGNLVVSSLVFATPIEVQAKSTAIEIDHRPVPATFLVAHGRLHARLQRPIELRAGQTLTTTMNGG